MTRVAVGCGDTLGNLLFAAASARHGLVSVTSVLASLYPVITVILAAIFLKERVDAAQWRSGKTATIKTATIKTARKAARFMVSLPQQAEILLPIARDGK